MQKYLGGVGGCVQISRVGGAVPKFLVVDGAVKTFLGARGSVKTCLGVEGCCAKFCGGVVQCKILWW